MTTPPSTVTFPEPDIRRQLQPAILFDPLFQYRKIQAIDMVISTADDKASLADDTIFADGKRTVVWWIGLWCLHSRRSLRQFESCLPCRKEFLIGKYDLVAENDGRDFIVAASIQNTSDVNDHLEKDGVFSRILRELMEEALEQQMDETLCAQ